MTKFAYVGGTMQDGQGAENSYQQKYGELRSFENLNFIIKGIKIRLKTIQIKSDFIYQS